MLRQWIMGRSLAIRNVFAKYQRFRYWYGGIWHQVQLGSFGIENPFWVTDDELLEMSNFLIVPKVLKTERWLG